MIANGRTRSMNDVRFVEVALPLPVDHAFTYSVPEALRDRVAVGMRATAPVINRLETGYIVRLASETDVPNVRSLRDLPDETPVFSDEMIRLCEWISDYYCCSLGEALECAAPAGLKMKTSLRYTLLPDQLGPGRYNDRQKKIIAALYNRKEAMTERQIAEAVGDESVAASLKTLVSRGILRADPIIRRTGVSIRMETFVRVLEDKIPPISVLADLQRKAPKQASVYLDLLHGEPERAVTSLYAKHAATAAVISSLVRRNYIERFERDFLRTPQYAEDERSRVKHMLNPDQAAAFAIVAESAGRNEFKTFLLRGVTGSGKTEVYLQVIEYILSLGRNAILLVPEISLTPQTVGRFIARFQQDVAVLHSGLGPGERYDEWRRAQRGDVRIVVGARSAVFAPLANLGIIIVDEEHDTSYKQSDVPRYHARDVAVMRAKMNNAIAMLGSATPSIESYFNSERGKFSRLELPGRATRGSLPSVEVVDMRREARETSGEIILSRALEEAVHERVAANEQVVLLLNRRGYSPFVLCPKCGWVAECSDCNVSMTYHANGAFLSCHYCNARADVPVVCGECKFHPLLFLGAGTQKAEDYLMRAFPGARVARMDADTTAGKGGHAKILGRFAAGEIDILIGTQMIAKGHDYPGVTLVGVVNADTSLSLPDFRAAENAFQLLTQVAGRAGRGDRPGKVILQSYRPNHYAVRAATKHDYEAFYKREIAERRETGYPPLRRMINFGIETEDPLLAERCAMLLHRIIREKIAALDDSRGFEILGPSPAVVHRVKKRYRWNMAVLAASAKRLNELARNTRDAFADEAPPGDVLLKLDPDPYGVF
jgi:primosomal protein N' (replication factor Y)